MIVLDSLIDLPDIQSTLSPVHKLQVVRGCQLPKSDSAGSIHVPRARILALPLQSITLLLLQWLLLPLQLEVLGLQTFLDPFFFEEDPPRYFSDPLEPVDPEFTLSQLCHFANVSFSLPQQSDDLGDLGRTPSLVVSRQLLVMELIEGDVVQPLGTVIEQVLFVRTINEVK